MRAIGDYHIHTIFSGDGKSELKEILEVAREKQLKEIAITDHGPSHFFYGIKKENIIKLHHMIADIQPKYPEINIIQGIEANIHMDGSLDIDPDIAPYIKWVNAGYHFGSSFKKDWKMHLVNYANKFLSWLIPSLTATAIKINTRAILAAINNNRIDMLVHPGDKGPVDIRKIAEAAVDKDIILEINASHKNLSVQQILDIKDLPLRFSICSDAHVPHKVGLLEEGISRALEAGLDTSRLFNMEDKD